MTETFVQARYLNSYGELLVFENYEVSNYGQVRNKKTGMILATVHNKGGYCAVNLYVNIKRKQYSLHRLVLSSFTDNTDGSLQVNHKDENKDNNCLTNLEWMTCTENNNYGTRNERVSKSNTNGKCSKPVLQYTKEGAFIREWPSTQEIERQLGILHNIICLCCNGKRKSTSGFVWRYAQHLLPDGINNK